MTHFPLFLDITSSACLIIGFGKVGARKLRNLTESNAGSVLVLDPGVSEDAFRKTAAEAIGTALPPKILFERRAFVPEDIEDKMLVFACTQNTALNARVCSLCKEKGILCNSASGQDHGSFLVPSHISEGKLTLAISTGGASPAFTRALKEDLENIIGKRYSHLLDLLEAVRPALLAEGLHDSDNAEMFRALAKRPLRNRLMDALEKDPEGSGAEVAALLGEILPKRAVERFKAAQVRF